MLETKSPRRVIVKELISGRFPAGKKPTSWDDRRGGIDKVKTTEGEIISLQSTGGQSSPGAGWEILIELKEKNVTDEPLYSWTLFGLKKAEEKGS